MRAAAPGAGDALSTFGAFLRKNRELRGLSLAEVAGATRLSPRTLAALEEDDFAALSDRAHAIFVARAYATAVGLDPEDTALRLEEALGPAADDAAPRKRRGLAWSREPMVWLVLFVTLAVCTLLLLAK